MSFIDTLKTGNVPKKRKKGELTTGYDEFMVKKNLKLKEETAGVSLIKPKNFEDIQVLIDTLKKKKGLIADFSLVLTDAQRMLDFLSGAAYALDGSIERIGDKTYLVTPKGIDICNKL